MYISSIDRLKKKLGDIETQTKESQDNLDVSQILNNNSTKFNEESNVELQTLQNLLNEIEVHNNEIKSVIDNNDVELDEVNNQVPAVRHHATNLTDRAMNLDNLLTESRDLSGGAVRAVKAYRDIVAAVKNASNAAKAAEGDSTSALNLLEDVGNTTYEVAQKSAKDLDNAFGIYHSTVQDLEPRVVDAIDQYKPVRKTHETNDEVLSNIEKMLENIQKQSLDQTYALAAEKADNAMRYVTNIEGIANGTFDKVFLTKL